MLFVNFEVDTKIYLSPVWMVKYNYRININGFVKYVREILIPREVFLRQDILPFSISFLKKIITLGWSLFPENIYSEKGYKYIKDLIL